MNEMISVEIDGTTVFVIVVSIFVLILQLLLCFKSKRLFVKLLPAIAFIICMIIFYVLAVCIGGWDGFGLLFFALLSFGLLFVSGLGWVIWAIVDSNKHMGDD